MRYAFAGDRDISVNILKFIIGQSFKPSALLITEKLKSSHAQELIATANLSTKYIFEGKEFKDPGAIRILEGLQLDYIIGIHFPYLIPTKVLNIPKVGFLNLHPAFLPYNKGWHTPSWSIIEGTPYGATLHFMAEELDAGDIIYQKKCDVSPEDSAHSLYQKVKKIEEEVFIESFPDLLSLNPTREKQVITGTSHLKKDLKEIQQLHLDQSIVVKDLINKLRGLTTNDVNESAFFIENGKKYFIQMSIIEKEI